MKDRITVTLDPKVLAWLKKRAVELDRSVSWVVNKLAEREIEECSLRMEESNDRPI